MVLGIAVALDAGDGAAVALDDAAEAVRRNGRVRVAATVSGPSRPFLHSLPGVAHDIDVQPLVSTCRRPVDGVVCASREAQQAGKNKGESGGY